MTAAFIYKRLVERFPDNPKIDLITFRMATAYLLRRHGRRSGRVQQCHPLLHGIRRNVQR